MSAAATVAEREKRVRDVLIGGQYRNVLSGRTARLFVVDEDGVELSSYFGIVRESMPFRMFVEGWEPVTTLWGAR